ncbi:hypothetical protein HN588_02270 [Candidatus Bathyarchaeota archaeon]|jgi:hypothetical protein|nr:hypothetical protein [Candidatus Bathyarchaeota archaeon]
MSTPADNTHQKLMETVDALIEVQFNQSPSLMDIFESSDEDDSQVITHTRLQEALGDDVDLLMKVAGLLTESGVEVQNDLLTEEDHQALEAWRKLAGIAGDVA